MREALELRPLRSRGYAEAIQITSRTLWEPTRVFDTAL
jgi:hypothetical protein